MGPWASAVVGIAALLGFFLSVMAFRGLLEAVDHLYDPRALPRH